MSLSFLPPLFSLLSYSPGLEIGRRWRPPVGASDEGLRAAAAEALPPAMLRPAIACAQLGSQLPLLRSFFLRTCSTRAAHRRRAALPYNRNTRNKRALSMRDTERRKRKRKEKEHDRERNTKKEGRKKNAAKMAVTDSNTYVFVHLLQIALDFTCGCAV